jgi:hypothetical protein
MHASSTASSIPPTVSFGAQTPRPTLATASRAPRAGELRVEVATATTSSAPDEPERVVEPAEPTDAKKPPPRIEDFALHTSAMGAYRYELVHCAGYRDPMLRIVSLRAGKLPLSITWSPPRARELLAEVQRYVQRIGPPPRLPRGDEAAAPSIRGVVDERKKAPR